MNIRCIALLAILAPVFVGVAHSQAAILEDFQFDDADNTGLDDALNSANGGNNWVEDTDHVSTIQVVNGKLNIVKNDTNFVTEGLGIADVTTGTLWMVADFSDWAILGSAPDGNNVEEIRFGFNATEDLVPPPSSTVLAEMQLSRNFGSNQFEISGTALGANGTNISAAAVNNVQSEPFIMAMKIDQDTDHYSIWYKDGGNDFTRLGVGDLEPTRDAIVVRMTINNHIGDTSGEFINLDRFYVTDMTPAGIPEPTTTALAALAGLALFVRRRAIG